MENEITLTLTGKGKTVGIAIENILRSATALASTPTTGITKKGAIENKALTKKDIEGDDEDTENYEMTEESSDVPEADEDYTEEADEEETETVTHDDVMNAARAYAKVMGSGDAVKKVLAKFKYKSARDVKEKDFEKVIAALTVKKGKK